MKVCREFMIFHLYTNTCFIGGDSGVDSSVCVQSFMQFSQCVSLFYQKYINVCKAVSRLISEYQKRLTKFFPPMCCGHTSSVTNMLQLCPHDSPLSAQSGLVLGQFRLKADSIIYQGLAKQLDILSWIVMPDGFLVVGYTIQSMDYEAQEWWRLGRRICSPLPDRPNSSKWTRAVFEKEELHKLFFPFESYLCLVTSR